MRFFTGQEILVALSLKVCQLILLAFLAPHLSSPIRSLFLPSTCSNFSLLMNSPSCLPAAISSPSLVTAAVVAAAVVMAAVAVVSAAIVTATVVTAAVVIAAVVTAAIELLQLYY